jgi:hypothetical protein
MRRYTKEGHEEYRRKVDEQAAKEEEARGARIEKETARQAWIHDGGRATDFEKARPAMRDEGRRRRVMDVDRAAREAMRNGTTSRI